MSKYANLCLEIERLVTRRIIPGISYAFIEPNHKETHYAGNYGYEAPYQQINVHKDSVYDIASLTKVIATTTRILQLIDEKKLTFDTPIQSIIHILEKTVTIKQLLLHCGGYASDLSNKYQLTGDMIRKEVCTQKLIYSPGNKCVYSDIGYLLLGMIIEHIDMCSLEESFQKHIFLPLHMKHTSYSCKEKANCLPYEMNKGIKQGDIQDYKARMLGQAGSAGLFTTLEDVVIFTNAFLQESPVLFSKEIFQRIKEQNVFNRTYGWSKEFGNHTLFHTGFTGTSIFMDIEKQMGCILFTNRIHPTRDNITYLEERKRIIALYQEVIK